MTNLLGLLSCIYSTGSDNQPESRPPTNALHYRREWAPSHSCFKFILRRRNMEK